MAPTPAKTIVLVTRVCGNTLAHKHTRSGRRLEHVVHTLDLQGGTLLVRPRADRLCDTFSLLS